MKVSGVTIVRDGVRLGYPFLESIRSLLPAVDELIVNVGRSDDGTWEAIRALADAKLQPFQAEWDMRPRDGAVLSEQTNRALERCTGDWAIYLQADEVLHEDDLRPLGAALVRHSRRDTEGLLFDYHHFFRRFDVVSDDWLSFYPRAVRAVRLGIGVVSAGDAAGFVRKRGSASRGLIKARSGARIFHYGWCDSPPQRRERAIALAGLYRAGATITDAALFPADLGSRADLRRFDGSHPVAMRARVAAHPAPPATLALRPSWWPPALRAYGSWLRSPRSGFGPARAFLPTWLANLRWRWLDRGLR